MTLINHEFGGTLLLRKSVIIGKSTRYNIPEGLNVHIYIQTYVHIYIHTYIRKCIYTNICHDDIYLLQLGFHPVAVVGKLVQK